MTLVKMKRNNVANIFQFLMVLPLIFVNFILTLIIMLLFDFFYLEFLLASIVFCLFTLFILLILNIRFNCEFTIKKQIVKVFFKYSVIGMKTIQIDYEKCGTFHKEKIKSIPYTYSDKSLGFSIHISKDKQTSEPICEVTEISGI